MIEKQEMGKGMKMDMDNGKRPVERRSERSERGKDLWEEDG